MDTGNNAAKLPQRRLRFSKRMVALSLVLMAAGAALLFSPGAYNPMAGVACGALGMAVFFTAGYYWGCDNESCS